MKRNLETTFSTRQYMLSKDFEIYYYNDAGLDKVNLHSHNYYEFYIFIEGDVTIQINEDMHPLKSGDIMLIPPNIPHKAIVHNHSIPYRRFVFWISQDYCNHLVDISSDYGFIMQHVSLNKNYIFHTDKIIFNAIQSKVLRLLEELHSDSFGRNAQIPLCVNDLILHLNRFAHEQLYIATPKANIPLYQSICQFIEEHIEEDLSLDRLAKEFFLNKYHIAHIFKDNIGLSVHQYITKKRLSLCREAILSNENISDIWQNFGFGDYSSFYRAFKKEYGISPKELKTKASAIIQSSK